MHMDDGSLIYSDTVPRILLCDWQHGQPLCLICYVWTQCLVERDILAPQHGVEYDLFCVIGIKAPILGHATANLPGAFAHASREISHASIEEMLKPLVPGIGFVEAARISVIEHHELIKVAPDVDGLDSYGIGISVEDVAGFAVPEIVYEPKRALKCLVDVLEPSTYKLQLPITL